MNTNDAPKAVGQQLEEAAERARAGLEGLDKLCAYIARAPRILESLDQIKVQAAALNEQGEALIER